jgi:hypothetical protein
MLVALNHMQVSVCTFTGRGDNRTGLTRFRKNIISFPQRLTDLQQHLAFVSSIQVDDVVNVSLTQAAQTSNAVQRARVLEVRAKTFLVALDGQNTPVVVTSAQLRSRLRLPWKPRDLQHALIVLRRRCGSKEAYIEDLRARRNFVVTLMQTLSKRGRWREHRGEEPMHAYYTEFDWLTAEQIAEVLPEDGVPESLVVHDMEDDPVSDNTLTAAAFVEWLWEGRFDCDVAQAFLRLWTLTLRGSDNDSLADLFHQLHQEYRMEHADTEPARVDETESDEAAAQDTAPRLPVLFIARLLQKYGHVTFVAGNLSDTEVEAKLVEDIFSEVRRCRRTLLRGEALSSSLSQTFTPSPRPSGTSVKTCSTLGQPSKKIQCHSSRTDVS